MAELYSISRLSEELRLDRRTISKRLGPLTPAKQNKTAKLYHLADVVNMLIAQAVEEVKPKEIDDLPEEEGDAIGREKLRLTRAQADKMELELAIARSEVIPATEVEAIWSNVAAAIKAKMTAIPSRAAQSVIGMEEVRDIEALLKTMVNEALIELADSEAEGYADDASSTSTHTEDS
jgi:phage terminase Nu1 subunit (DNA packaging protein)